MTDECAPGADLIEKLRDLIDESPEDRGFAAWQEEATARLDELSREFTDWIYRVNRLR